MATSGKGTGVVGYNVQTAVDTKHHLIIAHEVTNVGNDRAQLSNMAQQAREAGGHDGLTVIADRGYFKGEEILACERAGMTPLVPKPLTSGAKAEGRFGKQDFVYIPEADAYRCPAGELLTWRFTSVENGLTLHSYWYNRCGDAPSRPSARPARNGASSAGSTKVSSTPCSSGLTKRRTRCASAGRRLSTRLEPSRPGWARPIS